MIDRQLQPHVWISTLVVLVRALQCRMPLDARHSTWQERLVYAVRQGDRDAVTIAFLGSLLKSEEREWLTENRWSAECLRELRKS